jgi:hypothetical protein
MTAPHGIIEPEVWMLIADEIHRHREQSLMFPKTEQPRTRPTQ